MVDAFRHLGNADLRFGPGRLAELPRLIPGSGAALIITGKHFLRSPAWAALERELKASKVILIVETVTEEPSPDIVDALTDTARSRDVGTVVAIGGGSVLDAGKAVAAMIRHDGSVVDYLEGVGSREPTGATVPMIAVPTTAGTGSEATKNAVISRRGPDGFKKSLRHDAFIPPVALIDPELAVGCPPEVSLSCGMDAFCQILESWISTGATPFTDALAKDGLARFAEGSRLFSEKRYGRADELTDRGNLALAAYESGLTLANAGLGTVHGIAGPLGAYSEVPHGVACGLLLAPVFRRITARLKNDPGRESSAILARLALADAILENGPDAGAHDGDAERLMDRFEAWAMALPRLSTYGLEENLLPRVIASSSNKNSPVSLDPDDMLAAVSEVL